MGLGLQNDCTEAQANVEPKVQRVLSKVWAPKMATPTKWTRSGWFQQIVSWFCVKHIWRHKIIAFQIVKQCKAHLKTQHILRAHVSARWHSNCWIIAFLPQGLAAQLTSAALLQEGFTASDEKLGEFFVISFVVFVHRPRGLGKKSAWGTLKTSLWDLGLLCYSCHTHCPIWPRNAVNSSVEAKFCWTNRLWHDFTILIWWCSRFKSCDRYFHLFYSILMYFWECCKMFFIPTLRCLGDQWQDANTSAPVASDWNQKRLLEVTFAETKTAEVAFIQRTEGNGAYPAFPSQWIFNDL